MTLEEIGFVEILVCFADFLLPPIIGFIAVFLRSKSTPISMPNAILTGGSAGMFIAILQTIIGELFLKNPFALNQPMISFITFITILIVSLIMGLLFGAIGGAIAGILLRNRAE